MPFSKHHDGFCLWDSTYSERDVVDLRPGFDVSQALVDACRRRGFRHGFYFSVEEYEYPVVLPDGSIAVRLWEEEMAHGARRRKVDDQVLTDLAPIHERRLSGKIPVPSFVDDHDAPLEWIDTGKSTYGMSVRIPGAWRDDPTKRPSQHAWVIKFEWDRASQL